MSESAFPIPNGAGDDGRRGMSLRDFFAAASLAGFRASRDNFDAPEVAKWAYEDADAMLAEREKQPNAKV